VLEVGVGVALGLAFRTGFAACGVGGVPVGVPEAAAAGLGDAEPSVLGDAEAPVPPAGSTQSDTVAARPEL
jgi:hypothetical protein